MTSGNLIAAIALLSWPLVCVFFYTSRSLNRATILTILIGFLLLPSGVGLKIPMVPVIDKNSVPNLCAVVACWLLAPRIDNRFGRLGVADLLAAIWIFCPIVSALANTDTVVVGGTVLPGVGLYDGISAVLAELIFFSAFFIGRRLLRDPSSNEEILRLLAISGLIYSVPMLFEIRMSPVLASWVYGHQSTSYAIEWRFGGFRPVVFMTNGLAAAFFVSTAVLASLALYRIARPIFGRSAIGAGSYLGLVLVLCKSTGAVFYGLIGGFLVYFTRARTQLWIAVLLVTISISYPLTRSVQLFPTQALLELAGVVSEERAESLKFRFDQEDQLLSRASERLITGWGRYGRNRVYSEETGENESTTDGLWIITIGQFGLIGFLAQFGLLGLPVFRLLFAFGLVKSPQEQLCLSALALIIGFSVVEQLPNASLSPWTWLLVGSLLGRVESLTTSTKRLQTRVRLQGISSPVQRKTVAR